MRKIIQETLSADGNAKVNKNEKTSPNLIELPVYYSDELGPN